MKTELEGSLKFEPTKGPGPGWRHGWKGNVSRAALYGYARVARTTTYAYETTVRLLHRDTILLLICLKIESSLIYLG